MLLSAGNYGDTLKADRFSLEGFDENRLCSVCRINVRPRLVRAGSIAEGWAMPVRILFKWQILRSNER
jgi:hypothetical protein